MSERGLGNLTGKVRSLRGPIAESRPKTVDSYITTHSPQQHLHCHVAHHCPTIAGKQKLVLPYLSHLFEDCYCGIGERHTVLAAPLHSLRWHGPNLQFEVYLIPPRADHFAGPRGGQDRELQRPCCEAGPFPKLGHERCDLDVR